MRSYSMHIENAQWSDADQTSLTADVDGLDVTIPTDVGNRHYAEILRQVDAGTLVIADAVIPDPADAPEVVDPLDEAMKRIAKLEAALKKLAK